MSQSPEKPLDGAKTSEQLQRLRSIAQLQRVVILLIVIALAVSFGSFALIQLSPELFLVSQLSLACLGIVQLVLLAIFANKVYQNVGIAVLCGVLGLIPCISLLTLLVVNQRATAILTQAGIKVGFFGAKQPI